MSQILSTLSTSRVSSRRRLNPCFFILLLVWAWCLSVALPAAAEGPEPRVLVDPVNRLAVSLPQGWHGIAPAKHLDHAILTLTYGSDGSRNPQFSREGYFADDSLRLELMSTDLMPTDGDPSTTTSSVPFKIGAYEASAELVTALDVADGPPSPPTLKLSFDLHSWDGSVSRRVIARLLPADSLVLDRAWPILSSLSLLDREGERSPNFAFAKPAHDGGGLTELVQALSAQPVKGLDLAAYAQEARLSVTRPIAGSTVIRERTYTIRWSGAPKVDVAVMLLKDGASVACLHPGPESRDCRPAPLEGEWLSWSVGNPGDGTYQIRVQAADGRVADSGAFTIDDKCGPAVPGIEAADNPLELHLPFAPGTRWTVGGGGSFYGGGFHCNGNNDFYATDWNLATGEDTGARVLAMADGTVIVHKKEEGCEGAFGCTVEIEHHLTDADRDLTFRTMYAHLQSVWVEEGETIKRGQQIGTVGETGAAVGAHLHLRFQQKYGNGWASRCNTPGFSGLCPNGEMPANPQGYRLSKVQTAEGEVNLADGATYTSDNGLQVLRQTEDPSEWQAGESYDIAWVNYLSDEVNVELCHGAHGCTQVGSYRLGVDEVTWTVPRSVEPDEDYFIRVSDSQHPEVEHTSPSITIVAPACPTIDVSPSTLADGSVDEPYVAQLAAGGGESPYTFAVAAGALPPGLSLGASGGLGGIPSESGSWSFTVEATDASTCPGTRDYTLIIAGNCEVGILPASLPSGTLNVAYAQTLSGSGGAAPYTFALDSGTLPGGLSLGSDGVIQGVPTALGSFTFVIEATDSAGCLAYRQYTVDIAETPPCANGEICVQMPGESFIWTYDIGQCDGNANDSTWTDSAGYGVLGPFPDYCDDPSGANDFRLRGHYCVDGNQFCLSDFSDPNWNDEGVEFNWDPHQPHFFDFDLAADFESCGSCSP